MSVVNTNLRRSLTKQDSNGLLEQHTSQCVYTQGRCTVFQKRKVQCTIQTLCTYIIDVHTKCIVVKVQDYSVSIISCNIHTAIRTASLQDVDGIYLLDLRLTAY